MTSLLIDQQLPALLAEFFTAHGIKAKHISEYLDGKTMPDAQIAALADTESRTVVTKDEDFRVLHLTRQIPLRLLIVTCGNISTKDLLTLVDKCLPDLRAALDEFRFIELNRRGVYVYDTH